MWPNPIAVICGNKMFELFKLQPRTFTVKFRTGNIFCKLPENVASKFNYHMHFMKFIANKLMFFFLSIFISHVIHIKHDFFHFVCISF